MADTPLRPEAAFGDCPAARRILASADLAARLGPVGDWPTLLVHAVSMCVASAFPMALHWGPDDLILSNDAWERTTLARRNLQALGRPAAAAWPDIWDTVGPQFAIVRETAEAYVARAALLPLIEGDRWTPTWWDYSLSPVRDIDGDVVGILNQAQDATERVLGTTRAAVLTGFDAAARTADDEHAIVDAALSLAGGALGVASAGYATVGPVPGHATIERLWHRAGGGVLTGPRPPFALPDGESDMQRAVSAGEAFVVADVAGDPRLTDEERARQAGMDAAAIAIVPIIERGRQVAVVFVQHHARRWWSDHEVETLRRLGERLWQELARAAAERALRLSEERHRLIFEQARDLIFTADLDRRLTAANPALQQAIGPQAVAGYPIDMLLDEASRIRAHEALAAMLAHGGNARYEIRVRAPGRDIHLDVNAALSSDAAGRVTGFHGIARDVTDRHAFDLRQRELIDELNHRVKNTLAQVQALAQQSFREGTPLAEGKELFEERLATLAAAHDLLTEGNWQGATLNDLAHAALHTHDDPPGRMAIAGPPILLPPKAAIALILVLHELVTNAVRHGALSATGGRVTLDWRLEDGEVAIDWQEAGGPVAEAPRRRGFGLRMIERALASDLGAKVTMGFGGEGFRLAVRAPWKKGRR